MFATGTLVSRMTHGRAVTHPTQPGRRRWGGGLSTIRPSRDERHAFETGSVRLVTIRAQADMGGTLLLQVEAETVAHISEMR
jgi:hypothetical protein